ncbi:hypothetical protein V9T40_002839 [Parthenolecanium corni]|uniref:Zinc transporter ZIP13 n=1 Tax=Parthenolecanium corni TaxID=536013 RepID=A0AAN9Y438_9HEMI
MSVAEKLYSEFNESMIINSIRLEPCDESWMSSVPFSFPAQFLDSQYQSWLMALVASVLVGLSGIVPLLVIPVDSTATLKNGSGAKTLRVLLSFAVGGLLGDVFLHLLPEAWESRSSQSAGESI